MKTKSFRIILAASVITLVASCSIEDPDKNNPLMPDITKEVNTTTNIPTSDIIGIQDFDALEIAEDGTFQFVSNSKPAKNEIDFDKSDDRSAAISDISVDFAGLNLPIVDDMSDYEFDGQSLIVFIDNPFDEEIEYSAEVKANGKSAQLPASKVAAGKTALVFEPAATTVSVAGYSTKHIAMPEIKAILARIPAGPVTLTNQKVKSSIVTIKAFTDTRASKNLEISAKVVFKFSFPPQSKVAFRFYLDKLITSEIIESLKARNVSAEVTCESTLPFAFDLSGYKADGKKIISLDPVIKGNGTTNSVLKISPWHSWDEAKGATLIITLINDTNSTQSLTKDQAIKFITNNVTITDLKIL